MDATHDLPPGGSNDESDRPGARPVVMAGYHGDDGRQPQQPLQRRRRAIALVAVAAGLAAAVFAAYLLSAARGEGAIDYETATVARGPVANRVTASGTLSPLVTVQVGSQVSGRIQDLFVDFNSQVTKGQLIAKIDPRLIKSDVARAHANLTAAHAAVQRAEAELVDARLKHERMSSLAAKRLVAQAEADSAHATHQAAQAQLASSVAAEDQARAMLSAAQTNLAYTTIVSPIDGIVISRDVDVGQTVAASLQAPTLFTIAEDLAKMEVHTNVAESDVGKLRADMQVEFTVDAFPEDRFVGVVKQVRFSPETIQNVVTYDAVVAVDNPDLKLRPGMTADVAFVVEQRTAALLLPNAALRFRPPEALASRYAGEKPGRQRPARAAGAEVGQAPRSDARRVWKLGPQGQPVPARVRLGISDGRHSEVLSGDLAEGDRVLVGTTGPKGKGPSERGEAQRRFGRFL